MFLSQKDMFSVDVWVSPPPHKICDVLGVGDLIWLVEQNVWNLDSLITTTLLLVHLPVHDESQKKGIPQCIATHRWNSCRQSWWCEVRLTLNSPSSSSRHYTAGLCCCYIAHEKFKRVQRGVSQLCCGSTCHQVDTSADQICCLKAQTGVAWCLMTSLRLSACFNNIHVVFKWLHTVYPCFIVDCRNTSFGLFWKTPKTQRPSLLEMKDKGGCEFF